QLAIVDGVGDVVRARRAAQIDLKHDVDGELLALFALEVVDTVVPVYSQPGQGDGVAHRGAPIAASTRSASTVGRTSWTRTPQAPATTASRLAAIEAASRWSGGRGVPSGAASSVPRYDLRLAPTSTGKPSAMS